MEGIFLEEAHPRSGRRAVFEVNGYSGWLHLSGGDELEPERKALAFSTGHLASLEEAVKVASAGGRPPLAGEYASKEAVIGDPLPAEFFFWWTDDGESVALLHLGRALAMIIADSERGHTKAVTAKGFYGEPWQQERYEKLFGREIL